VNNNNTSSGDTFSAFIFIFNFCVSSIYLFIGKGVYISFINFNSHPYPTASVVRSVVISICVDVLMDLLATSFYTYLYAQIGSFLTSFSVLYISCFVRTLFLRVHTRWLFHTLGIRIHIEGDGREGSGRVASGIRI
jgi:hypothetical protein